MTAATGEDGEPRAETRRALEALRRSEERHLAVVESTRDYAIFTIDTDGRVAEWYRGAEAVFGWAPDEIRGQPADVLFVPEDRATGAPARERAQAAREGEAPDVRWHQHKDGSRVFIEGRVVPIHGTGGIEGFLKVGQDVTARRRADEALRDSEQRLQVLVRELQHRTRNVLAVVQALVETTARETTTMAAFETLYASRLAALSRAQGLLSQLREGDRVAFDALLRDELQAHGAGESPRVVLDGPAGIGLRSRQVQTLALAVHELATNAVKHGALAAGGGSLEIRWQVEAGEEGPELQVEWREHSATTAATEPGSGYGRELIERALPYQLDARTTYTLGRDGVRCTIAVPLTEVP
ncbi:sensor histidine kinase [Reyranella sp.]|uniref:sensor histidine kinase n=1 Tax=Reyranella sp. TaxID=1929291 RepID=UPI003BAC6EA1